VNPELRLYVLVKDLVACEILMDSLVILLQIGDLPSLRVHSDATLISQLIQLLKSLVDMDISCLAIFLPGL
jgi:hypothetical protein